MQAFDDGIRRSRRSSPLPTLAVNEMNPGTIRVILRLRESPIFLSDKDAMNINCAIRDVYHGRVSIIIL